LTAVLLITAFVLAVLLLNEREASGKAIADRDRAVKNYKAAEKWFTAAVSMASNEQELVNTLTQIQKEERRKWDRDWHGENKMKMSIIVYVCSNTCFISVNNRSTYIISTMSIP